MLSTLAGVQRSFLGVTPSHAPFARDSGRI